MSGRGAFSAPGRRGFEPLFPPPVERARLTEAPEDVEGLVAQARGHAALLVEWADLLEVFMEDLEALCECEDEGAPDSAKAKVRVRPCLLAHLVVNGLTAMLSIAVIGLREARWVERATERGEDLRKLVELAGKFRDRAEKLRLEYKEVKAAVRENLDQEEERGEDSVLRAAWPRVRGNLVADPEAPPGWRKVLPDVEAFIRLMRTTPSRLASEVAARELGVASRTGPRFASRLEKLAEFADEALARPRRWQRRAAVNHDCHEDGES